MKRNMISGVELTERKQKKTNSSKNKGWLKLLLQIANRNMLHNKGWN
jgi:hypothetical protein